MDWQGRRAPSNFWAQEPCKRKHGRRTVRRRTPRTCINFRDCARGRPHDHTTIILDHLITSTLLICMDWLSIDAPYSSTYASLTSF